jgi:hypothetical protein
MEINMLKHGKPEIIELTSNQFGVPLWLLVAEALRSNNERMHEPAFALCEALGPVFQSLLITELRLVKSTPRHRVRLLQAIGRTGPIAPLDDLTNLFMSLIRDKHPSVRDAATDLLYNMPDRRSTVMAKSCTSDAGGRENHGNHLQGGRGESLAGAAI